MAGPLDELVQRILREVIVPLGAIPRARRSTSHEQPLGFAGSGAESG